MNVVKRNKVDSQNGGNYFIQLVTNSTLDNRSFFDGLVASEALRYTESGLFDWILNDRRRYLWPDTLRCFS